MKYLLLLPFLLTGCSCEFKGLEINKEKKQSSQHYKCMVLCEMNRHYAEEHGLNEIQKKTERVCYNLCNRKYK